MHVVNVSTAHADLPRHLLVEGEVLGQGQYGQVTAVSGYTLLPWALHVLL